MDKLRFGPAGVPLSAVSRTTEDGILRCSELKLECMEMEFTHGVQMGAPSAKAVAPIGKEHDITLTAHGPYFINLNSKEGSKRTASRERILQTARIAKLCGAWSITFHAAYMMETPERQVQAVVKREMKVIMDTLEKEGNDIFVRPETMGKPTQWGTLDQVLELSQDWPKVMPVVDFAHIHAYHSGKFNTYKEFCSLLDKIEKALGKRGLKEMHIHVSGIDYGPKGEKKHLFLKDSDFNYKDLLRALKDYEVCGCMINESPNLETDAGLLKKTYLCL
jgi:deoxyribonuclease-4